MSSRNKIPFVSPPNISAVLSEKELPPPASLAARALAFCADSVLILLAACLLLKFLLPVIWSNECAVFLDYINQVSALSDSAVQAAAQGKSPDEFLNAISALSSAAAKEEALFTLFEATVGICFAAALFYFLTTEHFLRGKSLGKKIFKIRTVTFGTTLPPTFMQTLSRSFWKALTVVPVGLLILIAVIVNAHVVVFARRHRGWHDKLARTEVIADTAANPHS